MESDTREKIINLGTFLGHKFSVSARDLEISFDKHGFIYENWEGSGEYYLTNSKLYFCESSDGWFSEENRHYNKCDGCWFDEEGNRYSESEPTIKIHSVL